jgi:hypothetical protein
LASFLVIFPGREADGKEEQGEEGLGLEVGKKKQQKAKGSQPMRRDEAKGKVLKWQSKAIPLRSALHPRKGKATTKSWCHRIG